MLNIPEPQKIVIVLGMHRSGTSALAKAVIDLGFDPGENLMKHNQDNPLGFWEDVDIYELNTDILSYLYLNWDDIEKSVEKKIDIYAEAIWAMFGEKAKLIIANKLEKAQNIIIKDPRFCILLSFWNKIFDQFTAKVYHVLALRNPLDVAKSLNIREGISIKRASAIWYYYMITALSKLKTEPYVIDFETLIKQPETTFIYLSNFLGLNSPDLLEIIARFKKTFINKNLYHHQSGLKELIEFTDFYPPAAQLYEKLPVIISNGNWKNNEQFLNFYKIQYFKEDQPLEVDSEIWFNANLFLGNSRVNSKQETFHCKARYGNTSISFEPDKDILADEIDIFIGERICIAEIGSISIISENREIEIEIETIESNCFYHIKNKYLFTTNKPFLRLKVEHPLYISKINIELKLNISKSDISEHFIPATQIKLSEILKISGGQQNQIIELTEKIETSKQEVLSEVLLNEKLKIKNDNLNDLYNQLVIKCERLEFENSRQMERINNLKYESTQLRSIIMDVEKSISYRFTKPIRTAIRFNSQLIKRVIPQIKPILISTMSFINGRNQKKVSSSGIPVDAGKFLIGLNPIGAGNTTPELSSINNDMTVPIIFQTVENPLVSIIIPVHNHWTYTYNCLASISLNTNDVDFEVIIADDASSDDTANILNIVKNIKVIRQKGNIGFLKNCNTAAKFAKGKYLHFLNNDVLVHPHWLANLVKLFENDPEIGISGSKLIFPDGRLQEAGGIIWNDASGWNYGRFADHEDPEYNYVKEVDYVSGASLMIKKDIWDAVGGFDEVFAPAYYEDTDLAFRVRESGKKVVYQPLSVVTHFEGVSNGKELTLGIKKSEVINRQKFLKRWEKELLNGHFKNGTDLFLARDRSKDKKQILVIDHYVPHFDQDAGSRSTFSYLSLFIKMGFSVKFIGDNYFRHEPYTTILQQMGVEILYGESFRQNIENWFKLNGKFFDIVITHRMHIAPKYFNLIKKNCVAKIVYVGHDLQFISSLRKLEVTKDEHHRIDSINFKQQETKIFNAVDIIFPFSTYEAPFIKEIVPHKIVRTIPVYFFQNIPGNVPGFEERSGILFVGFFGHAPNIDAAKWFLNEVFPRVLKDNPNMVLYIVGSNPTDEILLLESQNVIVTGYVSDQRLKELYAKCKLAVLPLRYGAGVKGKLLEALYNQIPVVITPVAAEGVPEIENYTLIAENSEDFARKIQLLYFNSDTWNIHAAKSKELILKYYTEESVKNILNEIFFDDSNKLTSL